MQSYDIDERFLILETKISYQEKLIADLNEVLLSRGREVDQLLLRVDVLEKLMREGPPENPANEPPPHY